MTVTDIEAVELHDIEIEVPCEVNDANCPRPAAWYLLRNCCDGTMAICDSHKILCEFVMSMTDELKCEYCGTMLSDGDLRFERINL